MNNSETNFINRKDESISEHNMIFGSTKNGLKEVVASGGAGMSFKKYPSLCTKCKAGKVSQENGICTYVMCRFQNKSVF